MQLMLVFVNQSELQHLLSEIYRTLKPGGYFELLDCEYQINRPGPLSDSMINHKCKFFIFFHSRIISSLNQGVPFIPI
jgi:ubiquinone/menaquinone biosynthesis C-methylase UbiE